jgi:hypothetical protein
LIKEIGENIYDKIRQNDELLNNKLVNDKIEAIKNTYDLEMKTNLEKEREIYIIKLEAAKIQMKKEFEKLLQVR